MPTAAAAERRVGLEEFAATVGEAPARLPAAVAERLEALNGRYRPATPEERDEAVLAVLKRLHSGGLSRDADENRRVFERGWTENLELCLREGVSTATLTPRYVKPFKVVRYGGGYVLPDNPYLTDELWTIALTWAFLKHLAGVEWIYEFGTGTGRYLYHLAHMFPRTRLVGLDWTNASVAILRLIAEAVDRPIGALQFDMLRPNPDVRLESDSAVVTVGSMEQLGDGFGPFLDYLLAGTPRVVVHFEPIVEFYRDDCLFDYLAILYHDQRRYLRGYYPALQGLAANGQIEILEARRFYYGDLYNEGSSLVVWRPRGG